MKKETDYKQDLAQIRSMMERSSKFMSLSGWAGVMAGVYALSGAYVAYSFFGFNPDTLLYSVSDSSELQENFPNVMMLGLVILILAISTAVALSSRFAIKKGEKVWNSASKHLVINMAGPLLAGGLLILILIAKGLLGLIAPVSLIFYGLALFHASKYTFDDLKFLGLIQMTLGLLGAWFVEYGLLLWAFGFGVIHIIYGIYLYYRYER